MQDDELTEQIKQDYRQAKLDPRTRAILDFAERLTLGPGSMTRDDVEQLRTHGLTDLEIHDVVQVVAYFNYINRVADGLGVDLEPEMPPLVRK